MKIVQVTYKPGFEVLEGNAHAQAAVMVLKAGESTGGPDNRHTDSDQWLYVLSGSGRATIHGQTVDLRPGSLVLIEKGEAHEIDNSGSQPLETLNFYVPPAY